MKSGRGRAKAVSAIVGADSYLAEQALETAIEAHLGSNRGQAVEVIRGDESSWPQVLDALRSPSLFVQERVVVVRGAEALRGPDDALAAYLVDPTPDTLLIVLAAKPDRRKSVWKRILAEAEVVNADPLKGRALRAHVTGELRRRKLALDDDAIEELIERVGTDLRRLLGEVDKLEAYGQGGRTLTVEDVSQVLGKSLARPLYRLADAFTERRAAEALEVIDELVGEGEAGVRILATLHRALRQVQGAKGVAGQGGRRALVERLGVLPFKVDSLQRAARVWSEAEIGRAYAALREADLRIKSSVDVRLALTTVIAAACPRPARGAGR
jgi:DNA polymerase III subunit delta